MEDRGARARHPDDEDGLHDPLVGDLGHPLPVFDIAQPVDGVEQDPLAGDQAADVVEIGVGRERVEQAAEGIDIRSLAQVVEAIGPRLSPQPVSSRCPARPSLPSSSLHTLPPAFAAS